MSLPVSSTKSEVRIAPASDKASLKALKRLNSLLLRVKYRDSFYNKILKNPTDNALTRIAFWSDGDMVVGGIRAQWEPPDDHLHSSSSSSAVTDPDKGKIYLMTLGVLSPFRRLGVASALLAYILQIAKVWGVDEVYAHVWVNNTEALEWYKKRSFTIDDELVKNYYLKLKPRDAWIVRLKIREAQA